MRTDEILNRIEEICREEQVEHLYLFGSYAAGKPLKTSDIDIMIKGCKNMGLLREKIDGIPTLKRIDVVNYDTCRNQDLIAAVERNGRQIY